MFLSFGVFVPKHEEPSMMDMHERLANTMPAIELNQVCGSSPTFEGGPSASLAIVQSKYYVIKWLPITLHIT